MTSIAASILTDRGVLKVSGPDAAGFLQGLITNDIDALKGGGAIHAGLLTPQGKILFEFIITARDEAYLIDCAAEHVEALAKRLGLYKLRSKVTIEDLSQTYQVAAIWPAPAPARLDFQAFPDPRLADMGLRLIAERGQADGLIRDLEAQSADPARYHQRRINLGIAEMGRDYGSGEAYPHEVNFDQLGGVHFSKGCYVGQEVVSRMKHKTEIRKRFVPVAVAGELPQQGAAVMADGKAAGQFGSSLGDRGLALLRLDRIDGAGNITAGNARLTPVRPDWADFDIPGAMDGH